MGELDIFHKKLSEDFDTKDHVIFLLEMNSLLFIVIQNNHVCRPN